jgi:flagellar capping protein FliD
MGRPASLIHHSKLKTRAIFQGLMPAHSLEERGYLEEDIKLNGITNRVVVWRENMVIVEGHTRYEIGKKFKQLIPIQFRSFATEEDAVVWALKHALGRRNLDANNKKLIAARLYEMLKQEVGNPKLSQLDQSDLIGNTRDKVAKMTGMSPAGVQRAKEFKERLDAAPEEDKPKIMAGEIKPPREVRTRAKKQGSVIFDTDAMQGLAGQIERLLDKMCRAYGLVDAKQGTVKETPEINGLRREFRAWKKNFEAEQKRLAKQYSERNGS